MISTFVSLAALLAGAPATLAPPLQAQQVPAVTAIAPAAPVVIQPEPTAPVQAATPEPVRLEAAPDAGPTQRPLPLIDVRAPQAPAEAPLPVPAGEPQGAIAVDEAPEAGTAAPLADPTYVSPTERRAILKAAASALGSVETAKGRFSQIDPSGQRASGSFALQRPGRMRFDYDAPVPLLIAADGATVAVRDEELETVDRVPLVATPLNLLLDDQLDFETEAEVTRVTKANGQVAITMRDRTGEADGELTLYLDSASYDLMGWRTLDGNDRLTFVELRNVDTGVDLNPRLFIVEDREDEDEDDRR